MGIKAEERNYAVRISLVYPFNSIDMLSRLNGNFLSRGLRNKSEAQRNVFSQFFNGIYRVILVFLSMLIGRDRVA